MLVCDVVWYLGSVDGDVDADDNPRVLLSCFMRPAAADESVRGLTQVVGFAGDELAGRVAVTEDKLAGDTEVGDVE